MKSYSGYRELFDDLFMQRVRVQDTVTLDGYTECAGRVAFAACLPKEVFNKFGVKEVTSKTIAPTLRQCWTCPLIRPLTGSTEW